MHVCAPLTLHKLLSTGDIFVVTKKQNEEQVVEEEEEVTM